MHLFLSAAAPRPAPVRLGLDSIKRTFSVDVARAEGRPVRVGGWENVAVRVELVNGCVGWGEVALAERRKVMGLEEVCEGLLRRRRRRRPVMTLAIALEEVQEQLPGHHLANVRAGVEMALIDAVANSSRIPLWRLFGGNSNNLTTSITMPVISPSNAAELAEKYHNQGFKTLKVEVGKDLDSELEVLKAVQFVHPDCSLILDAKEGFSASEAIHFLDMLHEGGVTRVLFEQPVHRDDWEGLHQVSHIAKKKYNVLVAADESCRSLQDAIKIINGNLAHVINIKLSKFGVGCALEVIEKARSCGFPLMIGGMVETRLATGFAAHLAAGYGCFSFVDLDSPLLLGEDSVLGGFETFGAVYKLKNARGHGGFLHWDNIAW